MGILILKVLGYVVAWSPWLRVWGWAPRFAEASALGRMSSCPVYLQRLRPGKRPVANQTDVIPPDFSNPTNQISQM